ncbi:BrnT family toxin [Pseudorhizobium flavum]|uniref:BrnT family toxin n=1 Tax=Pseudorhizobium flavum TaxID=1335061 RepID=UPI00376FD047
MIDWERILGFEWDEGNARKNSEKHDVSQSEAEQVFFNEPLLMVPDLRHSSSEKRVHALGRTDAGRLLHITFTLRTDNTRIRVISARDMSRKERSYYEQEA